MIFCRRLGCATATWNLLVVLVSVAVALSFTGCDKNSKDAAGGPSKIRVGYIGLTCEAPIFTAVEKGFFKEEGLEVELVKCNWAAYKDALALGSFDITHHLTMLFLKPILYQKLMIRILFFYLHLKQKIKSFLLNLK